jgi:hypothetical protein
MDLDRSDEKLNQGGPQAQRSAAPHQAHLGRNR